MQTVSNFIRLLRNEMLTHCVDGAARYVSAEDARALAFSFDRIDGPEDGFIASSLKKGSVDEAVNKALGYKGYSDQYLFALRERCNLLLKLTAVNTSDNDHQGSSPEFDLHLASAGVLAIPFLPVAIDTTAAVAAGMAAEAAFIVLPAIPFALTPQGMNHELQIGEDYRRAIERTRGPKIVFQIRRNPMETSHREELAEMPAARSRTNGSGNHRKSGNEAAHNRKRNGRDKVPPTEDRRPFKKRGRPADSDLTPKGLRTIPPEEVFAEIDLNLLFAPRPPIRPPENLTSGMPAALRGRRDVSDMTNVTRLLALGRIGNRKAIERLEILAKTNTGAAAALRQLKNDRAELFVK